jgi:hypothetical protein
VQAILAILGLFLIHLLIAVTVPTGWHTFSETWAHVIAVWCAIVALAIRTLEEGLQPKAELNRYRRYRMGVQDVLRRFDEANTFSRKVQCMIDLERLSFQEMCDFLRSHYEAKFVM